MLSKSKSLNHAAATAAANAASNRLALQLDQQKPSTSPDKPLEEKTVGELVKEATRTHKDTTATAQRALKVRSMQSMHASCMHGPALRTDGRGRQGAEEHHADRAGRAEQKDGENRQPNACGARVCSCGPEWIAQIHSLPRAASDASPTSMPRR